MRASWRCGLVPLLVAALVSAATLAGLKLAGEALAVWASKPHVEWNAAALCGHLLAALLVIRTYAQVRDPRLYAFVLVLLPLAIVQFFHFSNLTLPEERPGETATAIESTTPDRYLGLHDRMVDRYPELPARLRAATRTLHSFGFLMMPLLVVVVLPFARIGRRRSLRTATMGLAGAVVVAAAWLLDRGPETPADLPRAAVLSALGVGFLAALLFWRSPGGLGGGIAGLLLFLLPATLASAGIPPEQLGPLSLPAGAERLLAMGLPTLLLAITAREWIVAMSHSTQFDALTHIFNKAYAESIVGGTSATAMGSCYSVAIVDIDHFKEVNDTHGHGAGDDVLREVAQTIDRAVENRGLVCRTGGEEITVFFPGVHPRHAREVCEDVRSAVAALEVRTSNNAGKSIKLSVTVSAGLASSVDAEGNPLRDRIQDVVTAADDALYTAKKTGRNRVVTGIGP